MPEMLIGGEWRQAAAHEEIEVVNPRPRTSSPKSVRRAPEDGLAVATVAGVEWSRTDEKRAAILSKAADSIHESRQGAGGDAFTSEQGKPVAEAMGEVTHLRPRRYTCRPPPRCAAPTRTSPRPGPAYGMVIRRPMGVSPRSAPYNFLLTLLGTKVAPALAFGGTPERQAGGDDAAGHARGGALCSQEAGVPDGRAQRGDRAVASVIEIVIAVWWVHLRRAPGGPRAFLDRGVARRVAKLAAP